MNNLLVGDLGEEEIVACVCDDGDVLAYHTRAVFHTVERRSAGDGLGYDDGDMIKPFFNDNVGLSAWGLAIHKASRMIAVSANTHEITVFAFALSSKDLNIDPASSVDDVSRHAVSRSDTSDCLHQRKISPSQRAENVRISLEGHRDNIPNIAFCNTDDDKEGRWLFSADIDGEMLVWDIWSRKGLRRHTFARPPISPGSPAVFLNRIG